MDCANIFHFFLRRVFVVIVLLATMLSTWTGNRPADAADIASLIKKLDRTEWEIVSEEVGKRLPNLVAGPEEQAYFTKVMQSSQEAAAMAVAIQHNDYQSLGEVSAKILARDLDKMVARRFGKESPFYKSISLAVDHPELAKALTRAALNTDAYAAKQAIGKALKDYAREKASELQKKGEKFWKDMFRNVIPGGNRLAQLGVDPVDLYLQGIRDWSDFTSRARVRFNNGMLDCLALRYRKIRREGGSHADARLEIDNFDTGTGIGNNFDCSKEKNRLSGGGAGERSVTQRIVDFFTSTGRSTAASSELGLSSGEIVDLIEQYEQSGAGKRGDEFSEWLQDRLVRNVKTRAENLRSALVESLTAAQEEVGKELLSTAKGVLAAIRAEIAKLSDDKPAKPKDGPASDHAVPEKQTEDDSTGPADDGREGDKADDKQQPKPEKITVKCDSLRATVAKVGRASADQSGTALSDLAAAETAAREEGHCEPDVFESSTRARERLQRSAALLERFNTAIRNCDVDALPSLKSEASNLDPAAFDSQITLLQTAHTGVAHFKNGKAAFDNGNYVGAKAPFESALSAFKELPSGSCRAFADRAHEGLDNLSKILAQKVIVEQAINTCNIDDLKRILGKYENRKLRFFTDSVGRIRAALPKCEENDRIIAEGKFCEEMTARVDAANADFMANKLKSARQSLVALKEQFTEEKTKRCSDLPVRVSRGLRQLDALKAQYTLLKQAATNCDTETLNKLVERYSRETHPWFKQAISLANARVDECHKTKLPSREEAIADCRQQIAKKGKVYATTKYNQDDGSYSCHWCEKGQISNGNACVPDRRAAEKDCRRQAVSMGKVYAKTEIRNDGSSICHWCEQGQVYQNGKCGTPAAHAEVSCRQMAARKGKVYAKTRFLRNGQVRCEWCEPGQSYINGRCLTAAQLAEANCRQDAARRGKVYATVQVFANGRYNCHWCEPGQFYANGRCHSQQRAQPTPRTQPRGKRCFRPPPCHVDMSLTAAGQRREQACRARKAMLEQQYQACLRNQ